MKKISVKAMAVVTGGVSNRQCLIDGILTGALTVAGFALGGFLGGVGGFLGSASSANGNGCFG